MFRKITDGTHYLSEFSLSQNGQAAAICSTFYRPGYLVTFNFNSPKNIMAGDARPIGFCSSFILWPGLKNTWLNRKLFAELVLTISCLSGDYKREYAFCAARVISLIGLLPYCVSNFERGNPKRDIWDERSELKI